MFWGLFFPTTKKRKQFNKRKHFYLSLACSDIFQPPGGAFTLIGWGDPTWWFPVKTVQNVEYLETDHYLRFKE